MRACIRPFQGLSPLGYSITLVLASNPVYRSEDQIEKLLHGIGWAVVDRDDLRKELGILAGKGMIELRSDESLFSYGGDNA